MPPNKRRPKPGEVEHHGRVTTHRDDIPFPRAAAPPTSNALAWAFYLVSQDREVETRLRAELRDVLGDHVKQAGQQFLDRFHAEILYVCA